MQVDSKTSDTNPWKIYRNGNLAFEVCSHKTATTVMKAMIKAFPHDQFETRFQGKPISHYQEGGPTIV